MTTTTPHPAYSLSVRYESLHDAYGERVGSTTVVVRPDMLNGVGLVIVYASTETYALESRTSGNGQWMHRINSEWYESHRDIPARYRKARQIALQVELSLELARELIEAHRDHHAAMLGN